jgi:hypothetical protein
MTTSRFTRGAEEYVPGIRKPIALVDGARPARLMIEHWGWGAKGRRERGETAGGGVIRCHRGVASGP